MTGISQTSTAAKPAIWILIILAAVSPLAINIFVPSMPSIANDLGSSYATVQLGLSLYLFSTAAVSLLVGPISDKIGRKPALLGAMVIFLVGTAMCVFAQSASVFLAGRVIQSASSAGMILSRAMVRDIYPREKSASMIGYVIMGMAIAPMIGPAIGGYIDGVAGWRWSFVLLGAFGLVATIATWTSLPETNSFAGQSVANQIRAYKSVLTLPVFWLYTASASMAAAVFFGFLGGGPAVSSVFFKQTPFEYGLYFALCAVGYASGNGLAGRFSETIGVEKMMTTGALTTLLGPAISLSLFLIIPEPAPWMLFIPLSLVGLGNGMTLPNVTAAAISLKPEVAGAVSGLLGALQILAGAIASIIGAIVVGEMGSPVALSTLLVVFGTIALVATIQSVRQTSQGEQ